MMMNLVLKNWLENISRRSFMGYKYGDIDVINKWRKILAKPSKDIRELVLHHYQRNCNVIGATCSSIGVERADRIGNTSFYRNYQRIFPHQNDPDQPVSFTTVIQDESSKATPAELIQPFIYGKRAIVIGDHRQLPPMLDQEEIENVEEYVKTLKSFFFLFPFSFFSFILSSNCYTLKQSGLFRLLHALVASRF